MKGVDKQNKYEHRRDPNSPGDGTLSKLARRIHNRDEQLADRLLVRFPEYSHCPMWLHPGLLCQAPFHNFNRRWQKWQAVDQHV